jgi:hypothetical protein
LCILGHLPSIALRLEMVALCLATGQHLAPSATSLLRWCLRLVALGLQRRKLPRKLHRLQLKLGKGVLGNARCHGCVHRCGLQDRRTRCLSHNHLLRLDFTQTHCRHCHNILLFRKGLRNPSRLTCPARLLLELDSSSRMS